MSPAIARPALAAVLALAALGAGGCATITQERPSVTVTGAATASARPDIAVVTVGVVTQAPAAGAALQQNSAAMADVLKTVSARGIAERDVQTTGIHVVPLRAQPQPGRPSPPDIVGYEVSNQVRIRVRDLAGLGALLDALVGQGANTLHGVEFSIADPAPLLQQARGRAIADARQKAEAYAQAAGVKLGPVRFIRDATLGPPRPLGRVMAAQAVPIAAGEQELEVSVSVTYAID